MRDGLKTTETEQRTKESEQKSAFHHCVATFFAIFYQFIVYTSLAIVIFICIDGSSIWSSVENINNFFTPTNKQKKHQSNTNTMSERERENDMNKNNEQQWTNEKKRTRQIN